MGLEGCYDSLQYLPNLEHDLRIQTQFFVDLSFLKKESH